MHIHRQFTQIVVLIYIYTIQYHIISYVCMLVIVPWRLWILKWRSPTNNGSSRTDRIRKEPILVFKSWRQLVIHFWSSYIDIFLAWAEVVWLEGSEDCKTCRVSTHCDLSYSEDRKNVKALPCLLATWKQRRDIYWFFFSWRKRKCHVLKLSSWHGQFA